MSNYISTTKALTALKDAGLMTGFQLVKRDDADEGYQSVMRWTEPVASKGSKVTVGDETYGKESHLYFYGKGADEAERIANARAAAQVLHTAGVAINWDWCNEDCDRFQVRVSFFKGYHWWE